MIISFRTRLFTVSFLIVAAVLAAVLALGWQSVFDIEVARLDQRLCQEARRQAVEPFPPQELVRLSADVANKLRLRSPAQLLLRFTPDDGRPGWQSPGWPVAMDADALAWTPARFFGAPPPPPLREKPPHLPPGAAVPVGPAPECALAGFAAADRQWRAARVSSPAGRSLVAADLAATKDELHTALQHTLSMLVPLALLLTALGAWALASLTMRPVNRLREAMKQVTRQALDQRLPSVGEDREFQELIAAYNTMLARLEASFQQASRFSADAAHELKTPLTILRGRIEQAMQLAGPGEAQGELAELLDEVGRLSAITRKLLLLSQADAGKLALHLSRVEVSELLDEMVADADMLAGEQRISSDIARHLSLAGDAVLLRQLFNNLLSNALRYGLANGWVEVKAWLSGDAVEVTFANACEPIDEAARQHFFERFYRADAARNRQVDGSGLGLSLAREIARAHGGELSLLASPLDEVRFGLRLPIRALPVQ